MQRCLWLAVLACGWLTCGWLADGWSAGLAQADPPHKALIVDGQNNHAWQQTTPILKQILTDTGLFTVDVATSPAKGQDQSGFVPKFADYKLVLSNYNGDPWCAAAQEGLVEYVKNGGGLLVVHAANNSFPQWAAYNEMIGLGWRNNAFGERVTLDDAGKLVRTAKGQGPGAGHGSQHPFPVITRDPNHVIMQGLPKVWMHGKDELYHGQRGPAANMQILATAFADPAKGGTGAHEPMVWIIPFGKGQVVTNVMGHSPESMHCVGFQTILQRSAEWAATGQVTRTAVPENFPTADATSTK